MTGLEYRETDHTYWLDGKQLPGATRILADLGAYPGSGFFTENSRVRGQMAHLACQLADAHCPKAATLDDALDVLDAAEDIQPYLAGYLKFRREKRFISLRWEEPLCSIRLRVAGTPDTHGHMIYVDGPLAVVDAKSWQNQGSDPKHSAEVQTALYAIMLGEKYSIPPSDIERYVLKLPGDGNYRLYHCADPYDFIEAEWASCLWWRWKDKGIFRFAGDPEQNPAIGANA